MAYEHDTGRYRHDPMDPHSPSALRPHEFPSRGEAGGGALVFVLALAAIVGVLILLSAMSGEDAGTAAGPGVDTAPAAAVEAE